jgi:hypothetical protein
VDFWETSDIVKQHLYRKNAEKKFKAVDIGRALTGETHTRQVLRHQSHDVTTHNDEDIRALRVTPCLILSGSDAGCPDVCYCHQLQQQQHHQQ